MAVRPGSRSLALVALGLAACAAPETLVLDPQDNPAVVAAAIASPPPGASPGTIPGSPAAIGAPALSLPALKADFLRAAGSDTIMFGARDAHAIDPAGQALLARQAAWLRANPQVVALIEGHADSRHGRDFALALSERRAAAARNVLVAQGVAPEQIKVIGWGKERPATSVVHDATWLQNSRVVTTLTLPPAPQPQWPPPPLG